jgi:hypothetical protein
VIFSNGFQPLSHHPRRHPREFLGQPAYVGVHLRCYNSWGPATHLVDLGQEMSIIAGQTIGNQTFD